MSQLLQRSLSGTSHPAQRVLAKLSAKVSWLDETLGETISTTGFTESLGEKSVLINLEMLPPVGVDVDLSLFDGNKEIIAIPARVIRVERNIAKPKISLGIAGNLDIWADVALTAAQAWVTKDLKVNYSDDNWLN